MSCLGLPNVTLMKQNNNVWCVAQGEAATSALAWTSKQGGLERGGKNFFFVSACGLIKSCKKEGQFT